MLRFIDEIGDTGEAQNIEEINKIADIFFMENESAKSYKVAAVDFDKMTYSIFEFTCERSIKITCTEY